MLTRTLSMFDYSGLPVTLPSVEIEKQLQKSGYTFITEVNDRLYAFQGGLGGDLNVYGEPTKITVSSPALNFSETLDIISDGVLIKNDDMQMGVYPLYEKYNSLLIENEVTLFLTSYNTRIQQLISAGDDSTKESAELYLKKIVDGELGIIAENRLFEGVNAQSALSSNANTTTQLIELNQYLKATLYNEVGLNANFNMKRERLNSSEVDMNTDNLHPLIDNMLINRQQGIAKLNEMYGLEGAVQFGSIWKVRNDEVATTEYEEPPIEDEEPPIEDEEPPIEDEELTIEDEEPTIEDDEPIDEPTIEDDESKISDSENLDLNFEEDEKEVI